MDPLVQHCLRYLELPPDTDIQTIEEITVHFPVNLTAEGFFEPIADFELLPFPIPDRTNPEEEAAWQDWMQQAYEFVKRRWHLAKNWIAPRIGAAIYLQSKGLRPDVAPRLHRRLCEVADICYYHTRTLTCKAAHCTYNKDIIEAAALYTYMKRIQEDASH